MKQKSRILYLLVWCSLFVSIFVYCQYFLSYNYPFVEQLSFFRFSKEFAFTTLEQPGGVATYIASFLSQFFLLPAIGPLISAVLAVLLTVFLDLSLRQIYTDYFLPFLSAIPALVCMWLETDFNYYLSGTVSLLLACMNFWLYLKSRRMCSLFVRLGGLLLLSWPLYYCLGPNALLMVGLCTLSELRKSDRNSIWGLLVILVAIACPITLYYMGIGKDLFFQLLPAGYYVDSLPTPSLIYYSWIAVLANVILAKLLAVKYALPGNEPQPVFNRIIHAAWFVGLQFVAIVALMHGGMKVYNSATNYEAKVFDYYSRTGQWMRLLQDKHLRAQKNYMHTCYQNLALSSLNLMGDKLFACPQTGFSGLFIQWNKTIISSIVLSDVYWQCGNVALAQEMAFEGMIASRDGVNPRLLMRLVQTNLVEGNYPVAEKYINLLADTYSYAAQAEEYRKLLFNDLAVLDDAELGPRKKCMCADGLTSTQSSVEDLNLIIACNPAFTPAFHYYAAACLLVKDTSGFRGFIEKYHDAPALSKMPIHLQEAVIISYESEPERWTSLGVTSQVKQRFEHYKSQLLSYRGSPMLSRKMAAGFGDTYWYYFMFRK